MESILWKPQICTTTVTLGREKKNVLDWIGYLLIFHIHIMNPRVRVSRMKQYRMTQEMEGRALFCLCGIADVNLVTDLMTYASIVTNKIHHTP